MTTLKKSSKQTQPVSITDKIIDVYIFAILCIFPLFLNDAYFNILQSKYYFYIMSVVVLSLLMLLTMAIKYNQMILYVKEFKFKKFISNLSVTDVALIMFLMIAVLSTLTSDYVYEAFWGNEGRFSGLFLLTLYGVSYFIVTRFGSFKTWYLDGFLIAGAIVCLLGISDYFKMDVLGFKINMIESQRGIFTSTIGNINTYTAIVGMLTAVSATLFATDSSNLKKSIYYYCIMIITFFALIMGVSDNAYLSLAALFGFLPLLLFKNLLGIKKYFILIATFFSVTQCITWINTIWGDKVTGIEGVFNIIANLPGLLGIIIVLWIIVGIFHFTKQAKPTLLEYPVGYMKDNVTLTWPRYAWLTLMVVIVFALSFIFIDVNVFNNMERYGQLSNYLLFNDDWGTHRGYIWRNAIECFEGFSGWKKLVGFGPDTFGIVLLDKTNGNVYRETFDNAHNEYIHYLITVGIAGLLAYLVFVIGFCWRAIRNIGKNKFMAAILFAVICYLAQAFVNLNLPIATPLMWTLLMIGEMINRKADH